MSRPADAEATKPANERRHHPLIGWMKGTLTIAPGTDLTAPAFPEWADIADDSTAELAKLIEEGRVERKS